MRQIGARLAFGPAGRLDVALGPNDTWETLGSGFPAGWHPHFLTLYLPYTTIPKRLWSAPLPLIGWAGDWNLLWHGYRRRLRQCDLVLTDTAGVEALAKEGIGHARAANLFGCQQAFLEMKEPERPRDIDILFVGNLQPAVQGERIPWLARLARLSERYHVVITTGAFGDSYRDLLSRARIVFNRSIRGECNLRTFEAAAAGALLFQETDNREVHDYFRDRQDCVYYNAENLEMLLEYYLEHEGERRTLAESAHAKVPRYSFEALWEKALAIIEREWPELQERARERVAKAKPESLLDRCWQALGSSYFGDPELVADLTKAVAEQPEAAALHNALGLATAVACKAQRMPRTAVAAAAAEHFRRAVEAQPDHVLAGLNLAEALAAAGRNQAATDRARRTLTVLDHLSVLDPADLEGGHFPPMFDLFRVEWERAAWANTGQPAAEAAGKRDLLRWRLHSLVADLTDDLAHRYEATLARPDLPSTRIDLGCALVQAGRSREAIPHLRHAVAGLPFEPDAPRALFQALGAIGDTEGQHRLAHDRRLLARAAPQVVPLEPWFAQTPAACPGTDARPQEATAAKAAVPGSSSPAPAQRISLCMIVKNEEANLPACLESAADLVDEIIIVDTGSSDRTKEVAARFGARIVDFPWVDSFAAARNESLRHATGDWIFWLDADDRLDEDNRQRLRELFAGLRDENVAYVMKCQCLPDPVHGTTTVVDHVRLFRNSPELHWKYRVHEQILPALRRRGDAVRWCDVVIDHAGYQDPALRGRKLERDLRLLQLERAEQPNDPFTLFNLGQIYQELDRLPEALGYLKQSLERSHPADSIVRKLFALIIQCHRRLGQPAEALAACRAGRGYYPDDIELLYAEAVVRRELGDPAGAEACLRQLLRTPPGAHFASVDAGLRGFKTLHFLAVLDYERGKTTEAEAQWRMALAERPDFLPALQGVGNLYLGQGRWPELEQVLKQMQASPQGAQEAARLWARACAARGISPNHMTSFPDAVPA
jgi:tetratricopeptide (TPR) repeat protein